MIIGNNNNFNNQTNNFNAKFNNLKEQNLKNKTKNNPFVDDISVKKHANPINNNDMADKSLAMLHERYKNGLISIEEFNKKCINIGKKDKINK